MWCTGAYLDAMRQDSVQGAIAYIPGSGDATPPSYSDPSWNIPDVNAWRRQNGFPVFAVSGAVAELMMGKLGQYSGNISQVPFGTELSQTYNSHDLIRLYARMTLGSVDASSLPSLWVFLIIVLAILLSVVLLTSIVMHLVQRRHRTLLQRRLANGDVDLEALGIKRMNVPREALDKVSGTTPHLYPRLLCLCMKPQDMSLTMIVHRCPNILTRPRPKHWQLIRNQTYRFAKLHFPNRPARYVSTTLSTMKLKFENYRVNTSTIQSASILSSAILARCVQYASNPPCEVMQISKSQILWSAARG